MKKEFYGAILENIDMSAIERFSLAVFYCDPYTAMHAEHVAEMMASWAGFMDSPTDVISLAYIVGMVHDVGKTKIPTDILAKCARLTTEEYHVIKTHALHGADMIAQVKGAEPVIKIIRHHHEQFNGAGYPDGISGNKIPVLSRMLALCDSFDAMTTARCYREPLSLLDCLQEIKRCSGYQFDPELCDNFIEFIEFQFGFSLDACE